jgi:sugar phosphate permease
MDDPDEGSASTEHGTSPPSKLLIVTVILFLIGFMVQTVIMQNILAESTAKEQLDQVFGFFYTLGFTLGSFSSVIFGFMAETYGFTLAFTYIVAVNVHSMVPAFWLRE